MASIKVAISRHKDQSASSGPALYGTSCLVCAISDIIWGQTGEKANALYDVNDHQFSQLICAEVTLEQEK